MTGLVSQVPDDADDALDTDDDGEARRTAFGHATGFDLSDDEARAWLTAKVERQTDLDVPLPRFTVPGPWLAQSGSQGFPCAKCKATMTTYEDVISVTVGGRSMAAHRQCPATGE